MSKIPTTKFKSNCLALIDEVARTGRAIMIVRNGCPIAELHAFRPTRARSLIGLHRGKVQIRGDIVAPLDACWHAIG